MRSDLPPFTALVAFEAVARRLSFTRAAGELHLTPSAISHQIANLESFLGFRLFERSSHGILLSDAGENYLKRVAGALGAISNATNDVRKGARNTLYVHSCPTFAGVWLMPRPREFVEAYPEISLSLSVSPDHSDFALGQVDIDIRYGIPEWPNLVVQSVFDENVLPLASPDFLAQRVIRSPENLLECPLIQSTKNVVQWSAWFASRGLIGTPEHFAFRFDRSYLTLEAAAQGFGVALESLQISAPYIASGRLLPIFQTDWALAVRTHFIVCPERHIQRPEVTQFINWMRQQLDKSQADSTVE